MDLYETFKKFGDDYLKFNDVEDKLSPRPDVHAFVLLASLVLPTDKPILAAADHDIVYLAVDLEMLAKMATENDIQDLSRCGVCYDADGLYMNV
jgi:hypothetical protein